MIQTPDLVVELLPHDLLRPLYRPEYVHKIEILMLQMEVDGYSSLDKAYKVIFPYIGRPVVLPDYGPHFSENPLFLVH